MYKNLRIYILPIFTFLTITMYGQNCSDGIKNQDETGVDCGGICGGTCSNNVANSVQVTTPSESVNSLSDGAEQDCPSGIAVCNKVYSVSDGYTSPGAFQELFNTCLTGGEKNSVWYIFNPQDSGSVGFEIATSANYDFALFDITTTGCAGIPTSLPIRCNYTTGTGLIGLDSSNSAPKYPELSTTSSSFLPGVDVKLGETYALIIDNYSGGSAGFTLTFTGVSVYDTLPPKLDSASSGNWDSSMVVTFSEPVLCASILKGDFNLINLDNSFDYTSNLDNAFSDECTSLIIGERTKNVNLKNDGSVPSGNYRICLKNNPIIQDQCGNIGDSSCVDFYYYSPCHSLDSLGVLLSDTLMPQIISASTGSYGPNMSLAFSEPILITSVSKNDFVLTNIDNGLNYSTNLDTVYALGGNGVYADSINLTNDASLPEGNYSICLDSNSVILDQCGNIGDINTCINFYYLPICNPLSITGNLVKALDCYNGSNAQISATTTNAIGNVIYSVDNLPYSTDSVWYNLTSGTYSVFSKYSTGCLDSVSTSIIVSNPNQINVISTTTDVLCAGDTNGTISLSITNGNPDYVIDWKGLDSLALPKGNYGIEVFDTTNCSVLHNFNIYAPSPLNLNTTFTNENEPSNGTITAIGSGGTGSISYSIDSGATFQSSDLFTGLTAGTYTVIAKDTNECTIDSIVEISNTIGVRGNYLLNEVFIYPNPTQSSFYVVLSDKISLLPDISLILYNSIGEKMDISTSLSGNKKNIKVNTNNIPNGIYFIRLSHEKGIIKDAKILIN